MRRGPLVFLFALAVIGVVGGHIYKKGARFLNSNATYIIASAALDYQRNAADAREVRSLRDTLRLQEARFLDEHASARHTYVFIIGESINRHRMSLYGYHRPTSPRLEALHEQGDILVFSDAISAYTHTVPSLRSTLLLQGADSAAGSDGEVESDLLKPSLLSLFNQAGFATWWLSNQIANTGSHSITTLIGGDARHQVWLNRARHEGGSVSYDAVLLPALEQALRDPAPRKAIFLHCIGAHLTYALRYPPEEEVFTRAEDIPDRPWRKEDGKHYINTYDNAVRYTDKVVEAVIRRVRQEEGRSMVVFFADHGQEVYDLRPMRGQDSRNPTRNMLDIPFIIWFSPAYAEANSVLIAQARLALHKPFCLDAFFDTAAELARIHFSEFSPKRSLVSPEYAPLPRLMQNGRPYDELPQETGQP